MEEENEILTGFNMLRDMTKEQLIGEILEQHRGTLEGMELPQLRVNVIELRVQDYKRRLAEEAGVVTTNFGYAMPEDDNE